MKKKAVENQGARLTGVPGKSLGFLYILGSALLYLIMAAFSLFETQVVDGPSWFWPASGLVLAALVFSRRVDWPWLLAAILTASFGANLIVGRSVPVSLGFSLCQCGEVWLIASLLTYYSQRNAQVCFQIQKLNDMLVFLGVILLCAVPGALFAAFLARTDFWQAWLTGLLASVLGYLLIFPLLIAWRPTGKSGRQGGSGNKLEGLLLLAGLAATLWENYLGNHPLLEGSILGSYLVFPLLIWVAARFELRYVTMVLLFTSLGAMLGALNGSGQFASLQAPGSNSLLSLQLYLLLLNIATLNLSVAILQTKSVGAALASSEAEYRNLFLGASIGIFHSLPDVGFLKINPALARMLGYASPEELLGSVTDIAGHLCLESPNQQNLLEKPLPKEGWTDVIRRCRRKDGSLMLGKLSLREVLNPDGGLAYLEGFVEDVTKRVQAEEALKKIADLLNETQASAKVGGWEYDCAEQRLTWTKEVYRIYGVGPEYDPNQLPRNFEFYVLEDRPVLEQAFQSAVNTGQGYDLELRFVNAQGGHLWVRTRGTGLVENGRVVKVTGTLMDISERKTAQIALAANEEQLRLAMEASRDGMWDWRPQEGVTHYSPAYYQQLGYSADEFPANHQEWMTLVHPDDQAMVSQSTLDFYENKIQNLELEMRLWSKEKGWRWILSRGKSVSHDSSGKPLRIIGTHVDITEQKKVEESLRRANRKLEKQAAANEAMHALLIEQATHDALTGLYNRRFMDDALRREILRANREGGVVSVLMLDIDHFKNFNDQFGHEAGDQVLVALSSLLRVNIRESDIACRYGGEEFVVILPGASGEDARKRAELIREDFSTIRLASGGIMATISVGVAEYPQHGVSLDELLRSADKALYAAKNSGRNQVFVF